MAKKTDLEKSVEGSLQLSKIHEYTQPLACILTSDELLERGARLAQLSSDMAEHTAHSDSIRKELKAKEAVIADEQNRLASIIRMRREERPTEVSCWADYGSNRYYERREDTGEVIPGSERALRPEERQGVLPLKRIPTQPPTLDEQRAARQKSLEREADRLLGPQKDA